MSKGKKSVGTTRKRSPATIPKRDRDRRDNKSGDVTRYFDPDPLPTKPVKPVKGESGGGGKDSS